PGYVSRTVFDHASVLKLIEWRFGLKPLSRRVTEANNLALALDFTRRPQPAPQLPVPAKPPRRC
ncbi:MAG TPA: hypothetical protein VF002_08440, partial [Gaiellaceae bacterium]